MVYDEIQYRADRDGDKHVEDRVLLHEHRGCADEQRDDAHGKFHPRLLQLPAVEQARLLGGNWKIRPAAGLYFRREWCQIVDAAPAGAQVVRYWDLAATVKTESNDPDCTVGIKLSRCPWMRWPRFHSVSPCRTRQRRVA